MSTMQQRDQDDTELQIAEIRHRVANCFQLMISAIHCRLKQTADPVARRQLVWARDIIFTISLLQGRLTSDAGQSFADYLRDLAKYWKPLLEGQSVQIEVDADPIDLGPGTSSSLALIAQELVTNSVKHGFDGTGGRIRIELKQHDAELELVVADNGRGASKGISASSGFGMTIVGQLGKKIGATMSFESGASGTTARIRLPITGATATGVESPLARSVCDTEMRVS